MAQPHLYSMLACGCAALCVALAAAPAMAYEISTDRPDFVESSAVVGKGRLQIETSIAGERDTSGGATTRSTTTPTLLRWGVGDVLELRLETDGAVRARSDDAASGASVSTHGWSDVALGVKWHTSDGDEKTGAPAMAWLLHADIDSGSAPFRGQGVRPSLRMVAEWELPGDVSVGVMPGLMADRSDDGRHFVAGIAAVTVSKGWSDKWRSFAELAGERLASKRNGGSLVSVDVGATYLVTDNLQLDGALSFGATRQTPDLAWTVGVSVRF
jgi:hypothetical protein